MTPLAVLFLSTFFQNAAFTLVSRARNSGSLAYHAGASVLSNTVYLLVFRQLVTQLDNPLAMTAYVAASVLGGMAMHWFTMRFLEKRP